MKIINNKTSGRFGMFGSGTVRHQYYTWDKIKNMLNLGILASTQFRIFYLPVVPSENLNRQ